MTRIRWGESTRSRLPLRDESAFRVCVVDREGSDKQRITELAQGVVGMIDYGGGLIRSEQELLRIHNRWDRGDNGPLRDPNAGKPQRTLQDLAEIDLSSATALVVFVQSAQQIADALDRRWQ